MKAKNQPTITSEIDAKEKLIVYVYEYLTHSGAKRAAQCFLEEIQYEKEIQINQVECPGFLADWWCVFWDLYCAAPEKRSQPEPSSEARAFHEYNMRTVMSPSITQTSPPQQQGPPFMGGGGPMMGGARYGPHPGQMRGGPMNVGPRMQPMSQGGPPPPLSQMGGPPPPHPSHVPPMMGSASPRYASIPGHMTPGSSASSGPLGPEPGPSPGINRMTPNHSGSPHPQVGPPNGMNPMSGPPPGVPHGGAPPPMSQGGPVQQMQQRGGPPQSWQGNFNVNSPAEQQCFMPGPPIQSNQQNEFSGMMMNDGGMMDVKPPGNEAGGPPNQSQDEYVMPNAYVQQGDQGEAGSEIMKLKESLENNSKDYNDSDQTGFNMDFPESQSKW